MHGGILVALALVAAPIRTGATQTRIWDAEARALITDLSRVTAVAVTGAVVYAATPNGLAIYDRGFRTWRQTLGALDGWPAEAVTAMAADPADDAVWIGGRSRWALYRPFGRIFDSGTLPGVVETVVLDAADASRGAYFRASGRWYFVAKVGGSAGPAFDVPPPGRRIGPLSLADLRQRAPSFETARLRIERDEMLRTWPMTAAALAPVTGEIYIATDGNGVFQLDPVSYRVERLPIGILGARIGAVVLARDQVCAGSDDPIGTRRRAITCFREDLGAPVWFEQGPGLAELPGTAIHALAVGERHLWAGTDRGLLVVDRRTQRVEHLAGADDLPGDDVFALLTRAGGAWVGTTFGLSFVSDTARRLSADPSGVTVAVYDIAERGDTLWLATAEGLLARAAAAEGSAEAWVLNVEGHPLRDVVVAVATGARATLLATRTRLALVSGDSARWLPSAPAGIGAVRRIVADGDGFWIAGDGGLGFLRPTAGAWVAVIGPDDVPTPAHDLAVGRRYLWVATEHGLVRFEKRRLLR